MKNHVTLCTYMKYRRYPNRKYFINVKCMGLVILVFTGEVYVAILYVFLFSSEVSLQMLFSLFGLSDSHKLFHTLKKK